MSAREELELQRVSLDKQDILLSSMKRSCIGRIHSDSSNKGKVENWRGIEYESCKGKWLAASLGEKRSHDVKR